MGSTHQAAVPRSIVLAQSRHLAAIFIAFIFTPSAAGPATRLPHEKGARKRVGVESVGYHAAARLGIACARAPIVVHRRLAEHVAPGGSRGRGHLATLRSDWSSFGGRRCAALRCFVLPRSVAVNSKQ